MKYIEICIKSEINGSRQIKNTTFVGNKPSANNAVFLKPHLETGQ